MHFLNHVDEADLIKLMDEEEDADSSADEEYTISTQYNKYIEAVSRNEKSSKNPFRTFYIAVMHYGVWLLICVPSMALILLVQVQSRVFTAKCSEPQVGISNGMDAKAI